MESSACLTRLTKTTSANGCVPSTDLDGSFGASIQLRLTISDNAKAVTPSLGQREMVGRRVIELAHRAYGQSLIRSSSPLHTFRGM